LVQDVPVEADAEFGPVVGLDDLDPERVSLSAATNPGLFTCALEAED